MTDFEKLGVFYLGKSYDMAARERRDDLLLYDSKDLTTHAVCVGMTGSGKTGLCLSLIEEAVIDGIPAILIDPKGDLANLLLTFPRLRAEDFLPWVNPDEAVQNGLSVEQYAVAEAEKWTKGLADWGQDGARIQRLRDAADVRIYTPGSNAGIPVSVLKSFSAPDAAVLNDSEAFTEHINTTVASLLGLVGIEADPIQSREFIFLANVLNHAWRGGQLLDLAALIHSVQNPPITTIGVLDLESFYPAKDRFGLVMALNNLLASPGFQAWLTGEPLAVSNLLYTETGKPRISIFSIAHLNDSERMFFVALLLNQIVGWVRTQSGTTSLRALVYMDEIFGYFPPIANPPSKQPLLTLLKQARAFGVGVVLATQNPVDLDYKGLANCGTWFVGRLQAERDKARLLDGLESVNAGAGHGFDRAAIDQLLSSLSSRVFLLNNVHEDAPVTFQTRWALSYLRGPLTQDHIRRLMDPVKATMTPSTAMPVAATASQAPASPSATKTTVAASVPAVEAIPDGTTRTPALAQGVPTYFVPVRGLGPQGATLVYEPRLLGIANVRFEDKKANLGIDRKTMLLATVTNSPVPVQWSAAEPVEMEADHLEARGTEGGFYRTLPPSAGQAKSYTAWGRDLIDWCYGCETLEIYRSALLGETSNADEPERDFRNRLTQTAKTQRDAEIDKVRAKTQSEREKLEERLRKAEQAKEREADQARTAWFQAAVSLGGTVLDFLQGRKRLSKTNLNKAATAAKGAGRAYQQNQDITRAEENIEAIKKELAELADAADAEIRGLEAKYDPQTEIFETVMIKPLKKNIDVQLVALVWAPHWQDAFGNSKPAWS